jgi:hypothetical protein
MKAELTHTIVFFTTNKKRRAEDDNFAIRRKLTAAWFANTSGMVSYLENIMIAARKRLIKLALIAATILLQQVSIGQVDWRLGGNVLTRNELLGSLNNFSVSFVTNGASRMLLTNTGNLNILSDQSSIQFANPGTSSRPMMFMLASGAANPNRMVLAHSPAFLNWGLQYNDAIDQFNFLGSGVSKMAINLGNGNIGIGTTSPEANLHIFKGNAGAVTAPPNSPLVVENSTHSYINVLAPSVSERGIVFGDNLNAVDAGIIYLGHTNEMQFRTNGNISRMVLAQDGNLGIGVPHPAYKLDVCGAVRAKEIRVQTGWCDYVFADGYKLPTLTDVEAFIKKNRHLPGVTPGSEIENNGLEVGKVSSQMIKKIEELTLYVIDLQKQVNALKNNQQK